MRENTFERLRCCMTDIETELTSEIQDAIERLEFMHDRLMLGSPLTDQELLVVLHGTGYDPRPPKVEIKPDIRKEIEELTGTGNKVAQAAPEPIKRKGWPKGKPRGKRAVRKNGKPCIDVHQSSV